MIETSELAPPRSRRNTAWVFTLLVGAALLGRQVATGGPMIRVAIAVLVMGILVIPALERPRTAVIGLFILLPFLGAIRHLFLASTGAARLDPLLLVTSAVALTVIVALVLNREMDWSGTALSMVVFLLLFVGIIQIFNPSSSLLVGLTGVMINLIPISFFFIGRSISDAQFTHRVVRIVITIGALAAVYGLVQVFIGFRGFEKTFLATQSPASGTVGGTFRPFSFFNNAAEYAAYVQLAFVAALAMFLFSPKARRFIGLGLVVLIAYAGFLIGSRGFTIKIGLAVIILLATKARNRLLAVGIITLLTTAAVAWGMTSTSDSTIQEKEAGASQLVEQQLRALRDPLDPAKSTLPVHWESATTGIIEAITEHPFGLGTGVSTRGGAKFGGISAGCEFDICDISLAMGVPGGILYVLAVILGIWQAARVRRALPGPVWIGIWAMAATSIGAWLVGGNYAITPLIWFGLTERQLGL
jgi:hypothetical protein